MRRPGHEGPGKEVFGLHFPNPVGLAAGFDKNGVAIPAWEALGFGFIEIGTITALGQLGNPRPRIFRIPEMEALINRLGFNNQGAEKIAIRLEELRRSSHWPKIPVGINIGKSKIVPLEEAVSDYLRSFQRLQGLGDYFVLNVSSPNTPDLRKLQEKAAIGELFGAIQRVNQGKPLLVKIAPDLTFTQLDDILTLAVEYRLAGVIATNTTTDQQVIPEHRRQQGGLSGKPLRMRSLEILRHLKKQSSLPVISVGGIMNEDDAKDAVRCRGRARSNLHRAHLSRTRFGATNCEAGVRIQEPGARMMRIRSSGFRRTEVQEFRNWESRRAKVGSIILTPDS